VRADQGLLGRIKFARFDPMRIGNVVCVVAFNFVSFAQGPSSRRVPEHASVGFAIIEVTRRAPAAFSSVPHVNARGRTMTYWTTTHILNWIGSTLSIVGLAYRVGGWRNYWRV